MKAAAALSAPPAAPAEIAVPAVAPTDLNGAWDVILFWSRTEPPSSNGMVLNVAEDGKLTGSF
jgi:hypothetical protein